MTNLTSAEYSFGMSPIDVASGQWWRLLTATFMHASVMHILFNMYALLVLGASLERVLGTLRFAAIYFMAALGGSVAALWFSSIYTISVGASGAIFGLMTATIVVGRSRQIDTSQIMFWLGLNVVLGFLSPGIDWRAHLGGALVGAIAARILASRTSASANPRGPWFQIGLLFALLVVLVVVRNQQILTHLVR
jgi:membrane associated rhomboid family serine protease